MRAESEPGVGSTFHLFLPALPATAFLEDTEDGRLDQAPGGQESILLVEDEPAILKMVEMMLERLGYNVIPASSPAEAIRLSGEVKEKIHVLMTDVIMPEMNGRDLARNILTLYPDIQRLFMSGYTADVIAHHGVLDKGVHFIQKPFTMRELAQKVRIALDRNA